MKVKIIIIGVWLPYGHDDNKWNHKTMEDNKQVLHNDLGNILRRKHELVLKRYQKKQPIGAVGKRYFLPVIITGKGIVISCFVTKSGK